MAIPWSISDLLNYPKIGPSKTTHLEGAESECLLYLAAGSSGVIRNIWMTDNFSTMGSPGTAVLWSGGSGRQDFRNWEVRVWTDRGNIANLLLPPADPDIRLPLAQLLGGYFSPEPNERWIETDYLQIGYLKGVVGIFAMAFKYPIPYSNGCLIQLGFESGGVWTPASRISYAWAGYDEGPLPDMPYKNLRLKTSRWSGATTENAPAVFLNEASGVGVAGFLWCSLKTGDATDVWMNSNWTWRTDGTDNDVWQASGLEDIFGLKSVYGFVYGAYFDRQVGCFYKGTTPDPEAGIVEAYRTFQTDPVYWTDGGCAFYPGNVLPSLNISEGYITLLYYQGIEVPMNYIRAVPIRVT